MNAYAMFDSPSAAWKAIRNLRKAGITNESISLLGSKGVPDASELTPTPKEEKRKVNVTAVSAATVALGAGLSGWLAGGAVLGGIFAAGPLFVGLATAGLGAIVGGIAANLVSQGATVDRADHYQEQILGGASMVGVEIMSGSEESIKTLLLAESGAREVFFAELEESATMVQHTPGTASK